MAHALTRKQGYDMDHGEGNKDDDLKVFITDDDSIDFIELYDTASR